MRRQSFDGKTLIIEIDPWHEDDAIKKDLKGSITADNRRFLRPKISACHGRQSPPIMATNMQG